MIRSRRIKVAGHDMHFLDIHGNRESRLPPLVILHGIGTSSIAFGAVAWNLRKHFPRIVIPDAPGHGFSKKPDGVFDVHVIAEGVFALLNTLIPNEVVRPLLYGSSLGGAVAIRYAGEFGIKLRGLMISSPGGAPVGGDVLAALIESFRVKTPEQARLFLTRLMGRSGWYTALLAPTLRKRLQNPAIAQFLESTKPEDELTQADLEKLTIPTRMIWGEKEHLLSEEHFGFFKKHLPGHADVERPAEFGHVPQLTHPQELAGKIIAFARTL